MPDKPKRGRGRPSIEPSKRRTITIGVRVSETELEQFQAAAGNGKVTKWLRNLGLDAAAVHAESSETDDK